MGTPLEQLTAEEKAQLQREVRALRSSSWLSEATDSLVWLALAPAWTTSLAKASRFPDQNKGTKACFDEAVRAGLCQVASLSRLEPVARPAEESTDTGWLYIMRSGPRFEALQRIATTVQQQALRKIGRGIARSIKRKQLTQHLQLLPGPIQAWFQLVTRFAGAQGNAVTSLADFLRTRVSELLPLPRSRDSTSEAAGLEQTPRADLAAQDAASAQYWIEAALPLGGLLGEDLSRAIDWCTRRLKLFAQRMEVLRRLNWFLPRKEQIAAFRDLLQGPDSEWALHYYGVGGMGKTMLARYIEVCLGPQLRLATSRVDFDELDPDYPVKRPTLLLLELAKELRLQDLSGAAQSRFDLFENKARNLDAARQTSPPPPDDPADDVLRDDELKSVISTFVDALIALDRGVILILDTCEELARLRVDGTPLPNVQATFKILTHLMDTFLKHPQRGKHGLRVIFAGRRPLASAGAQGWTYTPSKLPPRPYLRLHEIQGFTEAEARTYLEASRQARANDSARRGQQADAAIAPALWKEQIEAILERSRVLVAKDIDRDYQSGKGFQYPQGAGPAPVVRHQPMIVASLAAWVLDSPALTPDKIRSHDAEEYIEERVVKRLKHPLLLRLLPAVALLERFDRGMLQAAAADPAFEEAFTELRTLEWTDMRGDFVEVEPWLRSDLSAYFRKPNRQAELPEVRRALTDYLKRFTLDPANQDKVNWRHLDAALRLLSEEDPVEAATWWEQWELRIPAWGRYDRVHAWTDILLGEEGAVARQGPANALGAAVRATLACALYHQNHRSRLAEAWSDVEALAERHPDPVGRQRLRLRALAGQLTAGNFDPELLTLDRLRALLAGMVSFGEATGSEAVKDQVLASYLAALEAVLEYTERTPSLRVQSRRGARRALSDRTVSLAPVLMQQTQDRDLLAFGAVVAARALVLGHGASTEALDWLERSLSRLGMQPHPLTAPDRGFPRTEQRWLGWKAPECLRARLGLEWIRAAYPRLTRPEDVLKQMESVVRILSEGPSQDSWTQRSTDEDRLLGAVLTVRCAVRGSTRDETEVFLGNPAPARVATDQCNAHRQFPRLQSAQCMAIAARGDVDRAWTLLLERMRIAEKPDPPLAEDLVDLTRTRLAILRRMRLLDRFELMYDPHLSWEDPKKLAQVLALRGFDPHERGQCRFEMPSARSRTQRWQWLHWSWQGTYIGNDPGTLEVVQSIQNSAASEGPLIFRPDRRNSFAFVSWSLDVFEALLLARKVQHPFGGQEFRPAGDLARAWWSVHPEEPVEALTLALRLDALLQGQTAQPPDLEGLVRRVGKRRAAEIALEEGELLALRLPEQAPKLFKQAKQWFQSAADSTGALISQGCLALCLVGLQRRRRRHLADLQQVYQAHRHDDHGFLPTWETLVALARDPERGQLDTLAVGHWLPWIVRFCACLALSQRRPSPDGETPFEQWLRERYGRNPDGGYSLAPELDALIQAASQPRRSLSARDAPRISYPNRAEVEQAPARSEQVIQIDYVGTTQPAGIFGWHEIAMKMELTAGKLLRFDGKIDGTQPYRNALDFGTRGAVSLLRQFYPRPNQANLPLCLQLDTLVNPFCWEAVLQTESPSPETQSADFLSIYRITTIGKRRRDIRWLECNRVLALANDERQEGLLKSALATGEFARRFAVPVLLRTRSLRRLEEAAKQPVHLLFLFGSPLPTWRRDALFQTNLGDPISPEQLATAFPDLTVCLLFDWQTRFVARRSGSEREQACVLRQFAAQLFSHGVPVVLTVPPLPDTLAGPVLQFLTEALAGPDDKPLRLLLHGIQRSRQRIVSETQLSQENAWELAQDLCLYCNDRLFVANN